MVYHIAVNLDYLSVNDYIVQQIKTKLLRCSAHFPNRKTLPCLLPMYISSKAYLKLIALISWPSHRQTAIKFFLFPYQIVILYILYHTNYSVYFPNLKEFRTIAYLCIMYVLLTQNNKQLWFINLAIDKRLEVSSVSKKFLFDLTIYIRTRFKGTHLYCQV